MTKQQHFDREIAQLCYGKKILGLPPRVLPRFIVIEGLDGAGSSTQAKLLEQKMALLGWPCQRSSEPGAGAIGRRIRAVLQNALPTAQQERKNLVGYFAADRAEHVWGLPGIVAKTGQGMYCISERYLFSSLVYQGLDEEIPQSLLEIWQKNQRFPLPECFIYLDISPTQAIRRIAQREQQLGHAPREIFEREDFLHLAQKAYYSVIHQFRGLDTTMQIHILDATLNRRILHRQICHLLNLH